MHQRGRNDFIKMLRVRLGRPLVPGGLSPSAALLCTVIICLVIIRPPWWRLLTCVDVRVLLHVALLVEPLTTVLTRVGPGVAGKWEKWGQGAESVYLCMRRCVDSVLLLLKHLPHCLHSNTFSVLWIALQVQVVTSRYGNEHDYLKLGNFKVEVYVV